MRLDLGAPARAARHTASLARRRRSECSQSDHLRRSCSWNRTRRLSRDSISLFNCILICAFLIFSLIISLLCMEGLTVRFAGASTSSQAYGRPDAALGPATPVRPQGNLQLPGAAATDYSTSNVTTLVSRRQFHISPLSYHRQYFADTCSEHLVPSVRPRARQADQTPSVSGAAGTRTLGKVCLTYTSLTLVMRRELQNKTPYCTH